MKLIVLFSGQGGQRPEHVERLRAEALAGIAAALAAQGRSARGLAEGCLTENAVAQPLICAYQLTLWGQLAPRLPRPALLAGYSLGEMAAFAAASAYSPEEAVRLTAERARLMDEATPEACGLLAVLGLGEAAVHACCGTTGAAIAIRNGPTHFIVGGTRRALTHVAGEAARAGATRAFFLCVTTPSHTSLLAVAGHRFRDLLHPFARQHLDVPVLSGIDATVIRSGDAATEALAHQIHTRLEWGTCMETMLEMRPDAVLEIGPGNALAHMLLELEPRLEVRSVDDFRSLDAVAAWVASRARV